MLTHVRVVAWLHIVFGGLGMLIALGMLMFFAGIAGAAGATGTGPDARLALPILGGIGAVIFVVVALISLPGIIAGAGLLRLAPWARILAIVMSALNLLNVPIGTVIGIYGLWVLTKRETEALFARGPYQPVA